MEVDAGAPKRTLEGSTSLVALSSPLVAATFQFEGQLDLRGQLRMSEASSDEGDGPELEPEEDQNAEAEGEVAFLGCTEEFPDEQVLGCMEESPDEQVLVAPGMLEAPVLGASFIAPAAPIMPAAQEPDIALDFPALPITPVAQELEAAVDFPMAPEIALVAPILPAAQEPEVLLDFPMVPEASPSTLTYAASFPPYDSDSDWCPDRVPTILSGTDGVAQSGG